VRHCLERAAVRFQEGRANRIAARMKELRETSHRLWRVAPTVEDQHGRSAFAR
jgi:hypothetical protein